MKRIIMILSVFTFFQSAFAQQDKENLTTFEFTIQGMTCSGCANTATQVLLKMDGVQNATVDFETKKAKVIASNKLTEEQIKKTIANTNFEALFRGDSLLKPLSDEEKSKLDIEVIKGGNKIKIKDHLIEGKTIIFDFYADWCGPCRVFSPKVERLLLNYHFVALKKVDIVNWKSELSKQLTKKYQLPSLPFILIFDDKGKLLGRVQGNHIDKVEEIIKKK